MSPPSLINAFNAAVYLQPFAWLLLYHAKVKVNLNIFYVLGLAAALVVAVTGFSVGHYPTGIILIYILMVVYTVYHYRVLGSMKAVCLGFLLVFINSYFWEFPLHLENLLMGGNVGVQLVQLLHLAPLPFLLSRVKGDLVFPNRLTVINLCLNVFIFTCVVVWIRLALPYPGFVYLNHVSRVFALLTLLKIFWLRGKDKNPVGQTIGEQLGAP